MKKYPLLLATGILLLSVSACQLGLEIIHHAPPDLSIDFSPFQTAQPNAFTELGCDEIGQPSALLGGLEPSYPIAVCVIPFTPPDEVTTDIETELQNGQFLYATGGLFPVFYRYVIQRNGEFVLIKTEEEFRNVYAPIESPDEALSYVLAVRNLGAYFGIEKVAGYEYEVNVLEDTHVVPDGDGYLLNLYHYQLFGCGPHWTSVVNIHLASDGTLQELSVEPVFRDPNEDGLCVD